MIGTVSGIILPDDLPVRRDAPKNCRILRDKFWEKYDSKTLIYDCLFIPDLKIVRLYLPKPFNLEPMLRDAKYFLDGKPTLIRRWKKDRHLDQIDLRADHSCNELMIEFNEFTAITPIQQVNDDLDGKNVLYTNSKNNDLVWIKDWARFHARHQSAQAIVFSDNASENYDPQDVLAELRSISEIEIVKVASHPYRFGPLGEDCTNQANGKFMQTCMMTAFRDRFMRKARAILNVDVDELCVRHTEENIFDATKRSAAGHITFNGHWHYSKPEIGNPRHADHVLHDPKEPACPTKYAVCPTKLLGTRPMRVHQLGKVNRRLFLDKKRFSYLHCKQVSNSWKVDRSHQANPRLIVNETAQSILNAALGHGTSQ